MDTRVFRARFTVLAATCLALSASSAAFDTGAHFDMTRDALSAERFSDTAIRIVQVNNWFNDLYEQDTSNAYSGHVSWFGSVSGFVGNLLTLFRKENWPKSLTDAAEKMHFDSSNPMDSAAQAEAEWTRLCRATKAALLDCRNRRDALGVLTVMGISLHALQDFYTHSNWVEPIGSRSQNGFSGPGWAAAGRYGSHPTWFDVPPADRVAQDIYSRKQSGSNKAEHGGWDSPNAGTNKVGMNKDSAGRPMYRDAYITAAIASRTWVQAMKTWLGDNALWSQAMAYSDTSGGDLSHDQFGAFKLSWLVGHWNGNEGTKGGKVEIIRAGIQYFEGRGKTVFRRKWEAMLPLIANPSPPVSETPVPGSATIAAATEFVEVKIHHLKQIDDIDGGDVPLVSENDADWFTKATIAGQSFTSCLIDGHNRFNFPHPYGKMTFLKSVPKPGTFATPVWSLRVRLRTGNKDGAGTDMDLHLRISDQIRLEFPYGDFDDFERGRNDYYDFKVPKGMNVGHIQYLQLEKSGGGRNHEWLLGGIHVMVNGARIFSNDSIERWFRQKNESYRLPGFTRPVHTSPSVPIILELWDDDWGITGNDDQADICPAKGKELRLVFDTTRNRVRGDVFGSGRFLVRGAGDSDRAEIGFSVARIPLTPATGKFGPIRVQPGVIRPPTVRPPPTRG